MRASTILFSGAALSGFSLLLIGPSGPIWIFMIGLDTGIMGACCALDIAEWLRN
jgi:hypothetical protein